MASLGGKTRHVGGDHRHLAQPFQGREHAIVELGVVRQHDLDGHGAPGGEKGVVHETPFGVGRVRGDHGTRQAAGRKADQAIRPHHLFQVAQDDLLDLEILGGRLEHVIAVGQVGQIFGGDKHAADGRGHLGAELAAIHALFHITLDAGKAGLEGLGFDVVQEDTTVRVVGQSGDKTIGQVRADGAGTDDADDHGGPPWVLWDGVGKSDHEKSFSHLGGWISRNSEPEA